MKKIKTTKKQRDVAERFRLAAIAEVAPSGFSLMRFEIAASGPRLVSAYVEFTDGKTIRCSTIIINESGKVVFPAVDGRAETILFSSTPGCRRTKAIDNEYSLGVNCISQAITS